VVVERVVSKRRVVKQDGQSAERKGLRQDAQRATTKVFASSCASTSGLPAHSCLALPRRLLASGWLAAGTDSYPSPPNQPSSSAPSGRITEGTASAATDAKNSSTPQLCESGHCTEDPSSLWEPKATGSSPLSASSADTKSSEGREGRHRQLGGKFVTLRGVQRNDTRSAGVGWVLQIFLEERVHPIDGRRP